MILEAGNPRSSSLPIRFLLRILFPAYRWPPSQCPHVAFSMMFPLMMTLILLDQGSTPMFSFILNYFLIPPRWVERQKYCTFNILVETITNIIQVILDLHEMHHEYNVFKVMSLGSFQISASGRNQSNSSAVFWPYVRSALSYQPGVPGCLDCFVFWEILWSKKKTVCLLFPTPISPSFFPQKVQDS